MSAVQQRLAAFLAGFDRDAIAGAVVRRAGQRPDEARLMVDTYLGEMPVGLATVEPLLRPGARLLEVGCGIGLLTAFLAAEGYEIVGVEPGEAGNFTFMTALHEAAVAQLARDARPDIRPIGAEGLSPGEHGTFDAIFSANVLEHVMALPQALAAMGSVLRAGGAMRHLCPNYHVPFEPHLGIPLVPFVPRATRHVLRGPIERRRGVWDSVNFLTASRLARLARRAGLSIAFDSGIMGDYMRRLGEDPVFAERHEGMLGALARRPGMVRGLARALDAVPPRLASPMRVTLRHRDRARADMVSERLTNGA